MSKKRMPEPNHDQVGAMVPSLAAQACPTDRACDVVERLVNKLHESARSKLRSPKRPLQTTWKQWSPQLGSRGTETTTLTKGAYTCVLQLKCGSVCILRVDRAGNCSFVVRIKRSHWDHLAKAEGLGEWSDRIFYHPLQWEEGVSLLLGARAFNVTTSKDCVHHPHALSLLCGMGRAGCLSKQFAGPIAKAGLKSSGIFELVALPPSPRVVEECFCLLTHKATFKQQAGHESDDGDTDVDVPLSQHVVDPNVWGNTYGATICHARDADRFKEAGRLIQDNNVAPTLRHLGALNQHFANSPSTLARLAECFLAWQTERDEHANLLAPSDDEEGNGTPPPPKEPSPPREEKPAGTSKSPGGVKRSRASSSATTTTTGRAKKKKDEDEDMAEEDEFEGSSVEASSEEASSDGDAEDDDDDDDLGGRHRQRRQRRARAETEAEEEVEEAAPPPPPVAAGLPVEALKAMCMPCCDQLGRFLLANDGLLNGTTRWERLEDDHRLLYEATTVETVVAASLSIARTLMDAHTDPPEEAAVVVSGRERARVRALAAKTAAFATAALDDVDRAIAESRAHTEHLEGLRKRGYDALEAVEGGGFGNKDEGAPA